MTVVTLVLPSGNRVVPPTLADTGQGAQPGFEVVIEANACRRIGQCTGNDICNVSSRSG